MAATAAACQAIWIRNVLSQITVEEIGPIVLCIENKSTIDLAKNPVLHVASENQKDDILTKALTTVKFERIRSLLGIKDLQV